MADNFNATAGSGLVFAADDITSVLHQRVKMEHGADGSATDVSTASPMPASKVTGYIWVGTEFKQVKYAKGNISASSTDSSLVTAVSSKKIRVLAYQCVCGSTATTFVFNTKPAGSGTAVSMSHAFAANGGISVGLSEHGHFETSSGEGLSVTTGSGSTVGVQISYIEV